jgi:hypothetical protein
MVACAPARPDIPGSATLGQSPGIGRIAFEAHEIGVAFPHQLADFTYSHLTRFAEPGLGVSLQYVSGGASLSLYVFKGNAGSVPDGIESDFVRQHFLNEQVVINARLVFERESLATKYDIRGRPAYTMSLGSDPSAVTMLVKEFDLVPPQGQDRQLLSALWLTGFRGYFVKVRVTYVTADPLQKPDRLEAFRSALNRVLQGERRQNLVERGPSTLAM